MKHEFIRQAMKQACDKCVAKKRLKTTTLNIDTQQYSMASKNFAFQLQWTSRFSIGPDVFVFYFSFGEL